MLRMYTVEITVVETHIYVIPVTARGGEEKASAKALVTFHEACRARETQGIALPWPAMDTLDYITVDSIEEIF
jgi:hypothetical protein